MTRAEAVIAEHKRMCMSALNTLFVGNYLTFHQYEKLAAKIKDDYYYKKERVSKCTK